MIVAQNECNLQNTHRQSPFSQIVSKFRSDRFSAPQTLHLFLLSLIPAPERPVSRLVRRKLSPWFSDALRNRSTVSASVASASSSGVSGMVSKLEMLGLRDRAEVGVEGMEEMEEKDRMYVSSPGNPSLNFCAESSGECAAEVDALVEELKPPAVDTW